MKGFSLLQLIISLSIVAVLVMAAVPMWQYFVLEQTVATTAKTVISAINMSRTEAMHRGTLVTLCPRGQNNQCGGNWRQGMILLTAEQNVVRNYPPISQQVTLQWRSFPNNQFLQFTGRGITNGQNGSFQICAVNGSDRGLKVIVSKSGRVREQQVSC